MSQSRTTSTVAEVTLPDGRQFLLVEITIDCPACGKYKLQIAGHHLRLVRDILIETIDLHPDLTGKDNDLQVLERLRFEGRGGGDPTTN